MSDDKATKTPVADPFEELYSELLKRPGGNIIVARIQLFLDKTK